MFAGDANVKRDLMPGMTAEDFACFLESQPGAYICVGDGDAEDAAMLHSPHYDFNDAILLLGASDWVRLAEWILSKDMQRSGSADLDSCVSSSMVVLPQRLRPIIISRWRYRRPAGKLASGTPLLLRQSGL